VGNPAHHLDIRPNSQRSPQEGGSIHRTHDVGESPVNARNTDTCDTVTP